MPENEAQIASGQPSQATPCGSSSEIGCSADFVDFNVNDYVMVRLTKTGKRLLREGYDELNARCGGRLSFKFQLPFEDSEGWSKWQAWALMADLGKHMQMGFDPPFETTIRISRQNHEANGARSSRTVPPVVLHLNSDNHSERK